MLLVSIATATTSNLFKFQSCTPASSSITKTLHQSNKPSMWFKQETEHIPQVFGTMPVSTIAPSIPPHLILHSSDLQQFIMKLKM